MRARLACSLNIQTSVLFGYEASVDNFCAGEVEGGVQKIRYNSLEMDKPRPEKKLKVSCETSFWSFLNGRPTPVQHVAVKQSATLKWWQAVAPLCVCTGYSGAVFAIIRASFGGNGIMALAISNIPVLTGEVAEEFVRRAEEAERNRGCIDFSREHEEWQAFERETGSKWKS